MEALKKKRAALRTQFTRRANQTKDELIKDPAVKEDVFKHYRALVDLNCKLSEADTVIDEKLVQSDASEKDFEDEYTGREVYQDTFFEIAEAVETLKNKQASSESGGSINGDKRKFKLPKIEIPTFAGELKNWLSWWSRFSKIDNDEDLHETDKFEYLVQAIKRDTEAHRIVSSYPVTQENYALAIDALRDSFGQPDLLLQVYIRELLHLVITNVNSKAKVPLAQLCTTLESHLRSLEALQLKNADPAIWLYPLVESSLPESILRAWQRSPLSSIDGSGMVPPKSRLDLLREFMKTEVKNEQRIALAKEGFQSPEPQSQKEGGRKAERVRQRRNSQDEVSTAAGLLSNLAVKGQCIFCDKQHESDRCITAQSMTAEEKEKVCQEKRACFQCLRIGHPKKQCKTPVKCVICNGKHYGVMCRKLRDLSETSSKRWQPSSEEFVVAETVQTTLSHEATPSILLNTIKVVLINDDGTQVPIRLVGDTGSQRSYIITSVVNKGNLKRVGEEFLQNIVFGGQLSPVEKHEKFKVPLKPLQCNPSTPRYIFTLLARPAICGKISSVPDGPWIHELKKKGVEITDIGNSSTEIQILLGNDYWPHILTGKMIKLSCGLVATETIFGWTLGGRLPKTKTTMAATTISLLSTPTDISQLWDLEIIGIRDPVDKKTEAEMEQDAIQHFEENVTREESGRYVVALPWNGNEVNLPSNYNIAEKRLQAATSKLQNQKKWEQYDEVFKSWEKEGIISIVEENGNNSIQNVGHYLPHRPVFKESLTTPVRPVFDASCRVRGNPSINQCLAKGPNLIELIPAMVLRFQEKTVGVSADIRKAFQMIRVRSQDQPYQRFLWTEDTAGEKIKIYQHDRVVFGFNCSPFLLGATINYHLTHHEDPFAVTMIHKFYVDNLVASVSSNEEYFSLKAKATAIMADAKMELREWASSSDFNLGSVNSPSPTMSILGLMWNRERDTLRCSISEVDIDGMITKRKMLSALAKQFDPMGYLSPTTVQVKILLQKTWASGLGWEDEVDEDTGKKFKLWSSLLPLLNQLELTRHFQLNDNSQLQLHIFSDASQDAYAAAAYLRSESDNSVRVQLLLATSRLAPLSKKTRKEERPKIPRLELMGCVIGTRLAKTVKDALDYHHVPTFFWTDSSVALAWIQRDGDWGVFVFNRVKEILSTTERVQWRHIPGEENPADLPSRGCSPQQLLDARWWEGPTWLYGNERNWPVSVPSFCESEIEMEKKKITMNIAVPQEFTFPRFSSYRKNVAVIAWILRMQKSEVSRGPTLSIEEMRRAEKLLIKKVQQQSFPNVESGHGKLQIYRDKDGLLRVRTRLTHRIDSPAFIAPVLLPKSHPMVTSLIEEFHRINGHGGINFIREKIREKYWIVNSRRAVGKRIGNCIICKRYCSRAYEVDPSPLPKKRIDDCDPFTTVGVDLAGPLYLKGREKTWIVVYTCAVYRCIHLDMVSSVSTEAFMGSLERFVAHFGRPNTIFSDNGTNFVGAANIFRTLNWKEIEEKSHVKQIQWIFNCPTAAWWGGWWERLIRSIKDLLKRMLRKSKLTFDQLRTCLAGVETTINDRPLTIVSEDNGDLHPLSPSMFIRPLRVGIFPEMENVNNLSERYQKMKEIQRQLQERFRKEYLSLLVMPQNKKRTQLPSVGDVVFVGADNKRRFEWPLGKILELFPGRDGKVRMARVKTSTGILERPLQRLYPLELSKSAYVEQLKRPAEISSVEEIQEPTAAVVKTRRGRIVQKPTRYGQWIHLII